MGKYETLAKDIVKNVGGKENVTGLVHCITRLRFTLKDERREQSHEEEAFIRSNSIFLCCFSYDNFCFRSHGCYIRRSGAFY